MADTSESYRTPLAFLAWWTGVETGAAVTGVLCPPLLRSGDRSAIGGGYPAELLIQGIDRPGNDDDGSCSI